MNNGNILGFAYHDFGYVGDNVFYAFGWIFLVKKSEFSPKMARVMESAPACVLLSVIAPHFVSDKPYELIALAVTLWAAWRFSMMPTVLIAVGSSAIFRCLFEQI